MSEKKRRKTMAAALKYEPSNDAAPAVVAAGSGRIAEEIIARAQKSGIPINTDPVLAEYLCQVPVGQQIPPELYQAVAEVLAFIFRLDAKGVL